MLRDLRFALYLIVKDRWYSAVAIIALSLGIGVNATVFTLVNAVLIRGLPYKDSGQLYMLSMQRKDSPRSTGVSYADFRDFQTQNKSFAGLAGFSNNGVNLSGDGVVPQQAGSAGLTSNVFSLLGQPLLLGRDFLPSDEKAGAERAVIIGHKLWKSRYADDKNVLGKSVKIDGVPSTIVGVMPDGMEFPNNTELWTPIVPTADQQKRSARFIQVFGRIRPDVSRQQAQTEFSGIASRLAAAYPDTNKDFPGVMIQTFNERFNGGKIRTVFLALMGAVGFVLLIACANVANLLLSRSVHRSREIAVRIALGATRWRVVRQLLVESVCLGVISGFIALGLAWVGVRLFDNAVSDSGKPYWIQFTMDYTVFAYMAAICVLTGIIFGLAPALQVTKTNVNEVLKEGGRGNAGGVRARWMTGTMVVLELALTLVLLVGAGLMVRSFLNLYTLDTGIRTTNVMNMRMSLADTRYPNAEARRVFYDRVDQKLSSVSGIESATLTTAVPPFGSGRRGIEIEGGPVRKPEEQAPQVASVSITPKFFDTVGVQLLRGRAFNATDGNPGSETAIINDKLAAEFFKDEDPIGRRIRFAQGQARPGTPPPVPVWRTIIGISPTIRHSPPQDTSSLAAVYIPLRQDPSGFVNLLVRSRLPPGSVMNAVRAQVEAIDPDQPVFTIQTIDQMMAQQMWPYRVFGSLFAIFAVIALVMSAVGLYAVMAYSVTQRTPELGVRMALGASRRNVIWLIFKRGLWQMGLGLGLGLTAAFGVSRVLGSLLVDITATDPVTFASITVILATVAMAACLLPARRATRVDPLVALRAD
ncbi:MAG TPA: ABC transporter permease [Vicinamibacterales bacterium]|nr:ABC transporter permease [Vicinamibacterales bacterium]